MKVSNIKIIHVEIDNTYVVYTCEIFKYLYILNIICYKSIFRNIRILIIEYSYSSSHLHFFICLPTFYMTDEHVEVSIHSIAIIQRFSVQILIFTRIDKLRDLFIRIPALPRRRPFLNRTFSQF